MEKYEKPGERLVSKVPNEAYKEGHNAVFGVTYKLFYTDGSQKRQKFDNKEAAMWFIHNEGDHLVGYMEV